MKLEIYQWANCITDSFGGTSLLLCLQWILVITDVQGK